MNHCKNLFQNETATALCWHIAIGVGFLLLLGGCGPNSSSAEQKADSDSDTAAGSMADSGGVSPFHLLNDRVHLIECRLLNAKTRSVLGEPPLGTNDINEVLDYDEESINHDEENIDHDEESIDHDEENIDHDEEAIDHDEETIDHDEESIDHDEVFKTLVACRRDTLELQKKYLECVRVRTQCVIDGGSYTQCNARFRECATATRNGE